MIVEQRSGVLSNQKLASDGGKEMMKNVFRNYVLVNMIGKRGGAKVSANTWLGNDRKVLFLAFVWFIVL
jgi:hypothetical protein